jgi:hypothetical protein
MELGLPYTRNCSTQPQSEDFEERAASVRPQDEPESVVFSKGAIQSNVGAEKEGFNAT